MSGWTESEQSGQRATGGLGRGAGQSEPCRCRSLQPQNLQRVSVKPAEISSLIFFLPLSSLVPQSAGVRRCVCVMISEFHSLTS